METCTEYGKGICTEGIRKNIEDIRYGEGYMIEHKGYMHQT
jgi:hypothetical protein